MFKFMRRLKQKLTCRCYCPECHAVLQIYGNVISEICPIVTYECGMCSCVSEWRFDTPVPIYLPADAEVAELNGAAESGIVKHPTQPIVTDECGIIRFKENAIVRHLLDHGGIDLNSLACLSFNQNDREQFAQLIGYSVSGYGDLPYVSEESVGEADAAALKGGDDE